MTTDKRSNYFSIIGSAIGIIPLAILGLITPYQSVAALIGISDFAFVLVIAANSYDLGKKSK